MKTGTESSHSAVDPMDRLRAGLQELPDQVITEISPNDQMYSWGPRAYMRQGRRAVENVRLTMLTARKERLDSILDFGCGHGRMLRALKAAFPDAVLTACDADRDGVDFCARVFGATPVYSSDDPSEIEIDGRFDLIWCNSFFTHLDAKGWDSFLSFLATLLAHDGIFIFTTAGRGPVQLLRHEPERWWLKWMTKDDGVRTKFLEDYDRHGFAHSDSRPGWGYTAVKPSWVCRRLEQFADLRLLGVTEGSHVDMFSCTRVDGD